MTCCYLRKICSFAVAFILFPVYSLFAQTVTVSDSVELGAGDSLQCYYKLQTGNKFYHELADWDLAFQTQGITFGIWINEAKGEKLYLYPKGDSSKWNQVDTLGMMLWPQLHNSLNNWNTGAFNQNSTAAFDVGWGWYTGPPDHIVFGDSIYIMKMPNGDVKKIFIESLKNKVYKFKYANIDGSSQVEDTLSKQDFTAKNNGYYSLDLHSKVDREPNFIAWDLLFTRQLTAPDLSSGLMDIPFGSVYINHVATVSEVTGNGATNYSPPALGLIVDTNITAIGVGYKHKLGLMWVTSDTIAYYVVDRYQNLYELTFTGIDSSTGKVVFNKTTGTVQAGVAENVDAGLKMTLFPNPTTDRLNVVMNVTENCQGTVTITDVAGKQVMSNAWDMTAGTSHAEIPVQSLSAGIWLVTIKTSAGTLTSKFIKTN